MSSFEVKTGDCLGVLPSLEAGIAQTCVSSPPYFGLRAYGTNPQVWDGSPGCEHEWGADVIKKRGAGGEREYGSYDGGVGRGPSPSLPESQFCSPCGAWRGELGLEPTPELYVSHLVQIFREVRRTLRDDGTLWLNLGDSYNAYNGNRGASTSISANVEQAVPDLPRGYGLTVKGLKNKDLIGIPWMVAFALRADGWYLRSDVIEEVELYCPCGCGYVLEERIWRYAQDREIIWKKPNPMPESVTDRPTKAHEYLFLLSKSPSYFYDADAIREPFADERMGNPGSPSPKAGRIPGQIAHTFASKVWDKGAENGGRNRRSVWTVPTKPFPEAHFATFPEQLIEPCILAGSREGDLVIDPFSGAGTTGVVALKHGRRYLGCELNPEYVEMSERRLATAEAMAKRAKGQWAEIPRPQRPHIPTPLFPGDAP